MSKKTSGDKVQYALDRAPTVLKQGRATRKAYGKANARFAEYLKEKYGISRMGTFGKREDQLEKLAEYARHLQAQGYTVSTIHTYLAGPCVALGIDMAAVKAKAKDGKTSSGLRRKSSEIVKGRTAERGERGRKEESSERYKRSVDFQRIVGIRRAELAHLTGKDFQRDENGYWCVVVRKGKGGKRQLQRIPQDEDTVKFVRGYFQNLGADELVFSRQELQNHVNYHNMRYEAARKMYFELLSDFERDPSARDRVIQECLERYQHAHPGDGGSKFKDELTKRRNLPYMLRGDNRKRALAVGMPEQYDRVALMAVSVFKLSHWRLDVTVTNYMLGGFQGTQASETVDSGSDA